MMMFMATMMIMIIVMIFYIWIQWFCSLKNHERYRYLWRKIMKDINIYDATGIERVMKRLSIDIASVFSKLIASYDVTVSYASAFYLSRDDFISKIWQLPLQQEGVGGGGGGETSKIAKKRNVPERFSWIRGRLSVFFVFSQWKTVGSGVHFLPPM